MRQGLHDDDRTDATVAAARDWVVRLATGETSAADMRRFKAWLAQSDAHRAAFDAERRFWHRLGGLRDAAGPHTWRATDPARRRGRRWALAAALAACLALVVVLGQDVVSDLTADHVTAVGAVRAVTLPDGSVAHLNTDTAIDVAYGGAERRVELRRGEALFEVVPDPARPFRVAAADGVTQAVGTAFVVRHDGARASVTVTEGTVAVRAPAAAAEALRVTAAQRTTYRRGAPPRAVEAVDLAAVAAWRRGVIRIGDVPLDAAIAELDRYRPGRIVLLGGGDYQSVSGAFDLGRIDAAVAGLAATHGLTVTAITDYLLILR